MQVDSYQFDLEPVFSGLKETGITGREVARALNVSPAMVSKWRKGKAILPPEKQIFLTLMLAEQVERLRDLYADWGRASAAWHLTVRAELQLSMEHLAEHEIRNGALSAEMQPSPMPPASRPRSSWKMRLRRSPTPARTTNTSCCSRQRTARASRAAIP